MIKRTVSLILAITLIFSCINAGFITAAAADDTMTKLVKLVRQFPHGKYWNHIGSSKNNPEKVTNTPCRSHKSCEYYGGCDCNSYNGAIQCMGYANLISSKITGKQVSEYEEKKKLVLSDLRVGDIVRVSNHSVVITGVNGAEVSITDCNYGARCIIRWTTVDADWFSGVQYVLHLKGNNRKNTNTYFHDTYRNESSGESSESEDDYEIWQMEDADSLNIRKKANTSADIVGSVPAGEKYEVYSKFYAGEYLWAKVSFDGCSGYSVLNYSTYISGNYEVPKITDLKSSYDEADGIPLTWKKISGANRYKVYLYNSSKKHLKTYTTKTNSYTIKGINAGTYYIRIGATSTMASTWVIKGSQTKIKVTSSEVKPTKISISKTLSLENGKSSTLKVTFEPSDVTAKTLTWKSSNTKVATVDSKGMVKAVSPGKAVITCTSKSNSKATSSCTVTVNPSKIAVKQIKSGSSASSVALSWNKSNGATGYVVYRRNTKTGKNDELAKVTKTSYTDKKLSASTRYTYIIKPFAKTSSGTFYASTTEIKAVTAPAKVKGLTQAGSDTGGLKLQWKKTANTDFYIIYRYDSKKKKFVKLDTSKTNSYYVKTTPATVATYRVVAVSKVSDGYLSGSASESLKGISGLSAPKLKASSGKNSVTLSWNSVNYATEYNIYRLVSGKKKLIGTVNGKTTTFTEKSLGSGKSYTYYVRAVRKHSKSLNLYSDYVSLKVKTK